MNTNATPNFKALLTGLSLVYISLMVVMAIFGGIVYYLNTSGSSQIPPDVNLASTMRYVLIIVSPVALAVGYFIYKKLLSAIGPTVVLREKLQRLQSVILIRSACFEVPGLLGAVSALITGDNSFLLFTAIILVFFLLLRPTVFSIAQDLGLTQQEKEMLEKSAS